MTGTRKVKDLRTFSSRHTGTDIVAPCGVPVFAVHPGVARVWTNTRWASPYAVRVSAGTDALTTTAFYLSRPTVADGQIIQSGQQLGWVGRRSTKSSCGILLTISDRGATYNPTSWLARYVGASPPISTLFDAPAIGIGSFNVLGASHTVSSRRFATAAVRMPKELAVLNGYQADVVGLQELQDEQKARLLQLAGDTFGIFHWKGRADGPGDTDNSIIWRNSTMGLLDSGTYDIPYFGGKIRHVPWVLLQQKATGRTAYFMNVHNPADVHGPAQRWRNRAIAIERAKIIELRQSGRPVFLTGDFNDRQLAFCPLTADKLTISPNSVPSTSCAPPKQFSIDWIFAAGQTRFSYFIRDTSTQQANISDHPFVFAKAHLQD